MGFLKELGEGAGWLIGNATGGIIKGVGELTDSDFIRDIGDGVKNSTEFAGKQLGNVAEGVWNVGSGIVTKDDYKIDHGFDDLGEGIGNTAKAIGQGISSTVNNIGDVAGGLKAGDSDRALYGAKQLGKTALIATLGVTVLDIADVVDVNGNEGGFDNGNNGDNLATSEIAKANGFDGGSNDVSTSTSAFERMMDINQNSAGNIDYVQADNSNSHSVEPHWRTLSNGDTIWVDGDGDTSVNQSIEEGGGWTQSNPNYRIPTEQA
ncbi:hypothetical protein [Ureibacillus aquaedulcis]|uniref:Uncharacterized protein n=1 Tax=Ureibacillus aquaedulcis TaxID=3058421 RepID=A0ABT8GNZ5_9BACL|nr:hypothetical protein [Ureibacillus sp. BA0131]MDN4493069.1 hypothetical protein [Ureibacillus sp. BA0131]